MKFTIKFFLAALSLMSNIAVAYDINIDGKSYSVDPTSEIFASFFSPENDREKDTLLIKALIPIFESFKTNDVERYMESHVQERDFDGLEIEESAMEEVLDKRCRNRTSFRKVVKKIRAHGIDLTQAHFVGIKREPIESSQGAWGIRKVYLVFKYQGKEHSLYLKTLILTRENTWKMIKYALFDA